MKKTTSGILSLILMLMIFLTSVPETYALTGEGATGDPAHIHSYSDWTVTAQPTYTREGTQVRTCSCGASEIQAIPKLNAYNQWVTEDGNVFYFNAAGEMHLGWHKMTAYNTTTTMWCYFDENGVYTKSIKKNTKNKWVRAGNHKFYFTKKKKPARKGFNTIKGKLYYMDKYGAVVIGKFKASDGNTYTTNKDGSISGLAYYKAKYKTFILIDISKQKIWYYRKGKKVLKSGVVTGKPGGYSTPTGIFKVRSKGRNVRLTGATWDVTVKYWMAFYGSSYGMHDASWRSSSQFNNSRTYRSNGSHGCVNLRPSVARKLYNRVRIGTPVIIQH